MLSKKYFVGFENLPSAELTGKMTKGRPEYILKKRFDFFVSRNNRTMFFHVPAGMVYDFASIPRFAFVLFLPNDPHYVAAATIHDFLYQAELCPQRQADQIFLSAMLSGATSATRRAVMYMAVRAMGWTTYRDHSILELEKIRTLAGFPPHILDRPYCDDILSLCQPEQKD